MTIKTVLVAASGSAAEGAIELACRFSARLGAHIEAYHVLFDPLTAFAAAGAGDGVAVSTAFIDEMAADAVADATRMKALFEAAAERHGLAHRTEPPARGADTLGPSCSWREEKGHAPSLVAERARFFDLTVLGRSERVTGAPYSDTIERTLAHSGRPVLIAPAVAPAAIGRSIAVAWNGSPQSVRALAATLPVLAAADSVTIISAGEVSGVAEITDHLAWHGVAASHCGVALNAGDSIGKVLLDAARDASADLLAMGSYSRQPWRQSLFGGATHEVLAAEARLPLLLVH